MQGCGWQINEVLVFRHLRAVFNFKAVFWKLGRTQQSVWLAVCTAADQKFWKQKAGWRKYRKYRLKPHGQTAGGEGEEMHRLCRAIKWQGPCWLDGDSLQRSLDSDSHPLPRAHQAQPLCSCVLQGGRKHRITQPENSPAVSESGQGLLCTAPSGHRGFPLPRKGISFLCSSRESGSDTWTLPSGSELVCLCEWSSPGEERTCADTALLLHSLQGCRQAPNWSLFLSVTASLAEVNGFDMCCDPALNLGLCSSPPYLWGEAAFCCSLIS